MALTRFWTIKGDASYAHGKSTFAFIIQDQDENLCFLPSKLELALNTSILTVEMEVLAWAIEVVEVHGWNKLQWYSDSLCVVELVNSNSYLCGWDTHYSMLFCRCLIGIHDWHLIWIPRELNCISDKVAKYSAKFDAPLLFSNDCNGPLSLEILQALKAVSVSISILL